MQTISFVDTKNQAIREVFAEKPVVVFLISWFFLNILQASFTELTSDEGYYWFYAQHLQWGYYDHPPMIALMIRAGSMLFPGELGVRFFNVLFSTAGLYLFFTFIPAPIKKNNKIYLVLLAAPLLHYLSFIVFPDGPLLFFSLVFLASYKHFLKTPKFTSSLLLGMALAFMAYAKYHGALLLAFTLVANPKLLRSGYFYLALFVAALVFAPHVWWQYQHDFPTLKYHLSGRTGTLSFKHVGEYLSQQLFAIGPGLILIPFVVKTKDVFEKTLKFIIVGTFSFFLLSSFKTFVHFHWTSIALYPILYFAITYYHHSQKKWLFHFLILPFAIIFFIARLLLLFPVIPAMHAGEDYYHGRKEWAKGIAALADDKMVFMPNNLREASLYSFYSGRQGVTLYTRPEKKSQYELWGYEDSLQGREVLFITKYPFKESKPLPNSIEQQLQYSFLPSFNSYYSGVSIYAAIYRRTADSIYATVEIFNHRRTTLNFSGINGEPTTLICSMEKGRDILSADVVKNLSGIPPIAPALSHSFQVTVPIQFLPAGDYHLYFGIRNGVLPDAILSNEIKIQVRR